MFFKKNLPPADLSWLHTDMHSHLLPGIDDGSPDMAMSLELIKGFAGLGYKKIITTPHILWELYPNTPEIINSKAADVRSALTEAGIEMEFHAAAEYFLDDHFQAELKNRSPLLTLSRNIVLVEFSMVSAPMDVHDILFEMQIQNYQPLLAHPERYTYLLRKREFFDDLKNSGCQFALNLLSLSGYYGNPVQDLAEYLIKKDYYDYAGTDLHHPSHITALQKIPSSQLKKIQDTGSMKNHLL